MPTRLSYVFTLVFLVAPASFAGCALIAGLEDHTPLADSGPSPDAGDASDAQADDGSTPPASFADAEVFAANQGCVKSLMVNDRRVYWAAATAAVSDGGSDAAGDGGQTSPCAAQNQVIRFSPTATVDVRPIEVASVAPAEVGAAGGKVVWTAQKALSANCMRQANADGTSPANLITGANCKVTNWKIARMGRDATSVVALFVAPGTGARWVTQIREAAGSDVLSVSNGIDYAFVASTGSDFFLASPDTIARVFNTQSTVEIYRVSNAGEDRKIADLTADDSALYWVGQDGTVFRFQLTSQPVGPPKKIGSVSGGVKRIATRNRDPYVYVTEEIDVDKGMVRALAKTGGGPWVIATDLKLPSAIDVDEDGVYWSNTGDSTIMRALRR